jgi:hypothetical protein
MISTGVLWIKMQEEKALHSMQQVVSRPGPNTTPGGGGNTRSQTIIITAITMFALSGLMIGFAVGAFTRPQQTSLSTPRQQTTAPAVGKTPTAVPTQVTQIIALGYPVIANISTAEIADGATSYTFSAHPVDQSIDQGHGKQVHASNITCKIWLMKDDNPLATLRGANGRFHAIDTIAQPMPNEVQNALLFDGSQQTQPCSPDGETTWKYRVATSIDPGPYTLVVLTDWSGVRYNWFAATVEIKQPR